MYIQQEEGHRLVVSEKDMIAELRSSIDRWVEGHPKRTLAKLAKLAKLAPSTVRYIAQGERVPKTEAVFTLIQVVMTLKERLAFCIKYYPSLAKILQVTYDKDMRNEPNEENLRKYLIKEPHNKLFNMAATAVGITRDVVTRVAGDMGHQAIEEMLADEVLIEDGERIKYTHKAWSLTSPDDSLSQISASTQHFQKELIGTDAAALAHFTCSVRKEDIPVLKKIISDFLTQFAVVKDDPEREGDVTLFCDLVYSLYDRTQWEGRK